MRHETQAFLIAAGLVVIALLGLVVVWKVTKSLIKLIFWLAALLILAAGGWWLLGKFGILPPMAWPA